jgi:hypothetical protein
MTVAKTIGSDSLFPYWQEMTKACKSVGVNKKNVKAQAEPLLKKHFGLTYADTILLVALIQQVDNWIASSLPIHNLDRYSTSVIRVFRGIFPAVLSKPLYYSNDKIRIPHHGKIEAGSKIVRTRTSGIMNWSYGHPVTVAPEDVIISAVVPSKYVLFANMDQKLVRRIQRSAYWDNKHLELDPLSYAIMRFCEHLDKYSHEHEVITYGLPKVKCVVQE